MALVVASLMVAACSGSREQSKPASTTAAPTSTNVATGLTDAEPADDAQGVPVTAASDLTDLVGREPVVTAATGLAGGYRIKDFPANLQFVNNGGGTGDLSLTGCDVATFPVTFGTEHS